jgi:hypothetical protein
METGPQMGAGQLETVVRAERVNKQIEDTREQERIANERQKQEEEEKQKKYQLTIARESWERRFQRDDHGNWLIEYDMNGKAERIGPWSKRIVEEAGDEDAGAQYWVHDVEGVESSWVPPVAPHLAPPHAPPTATASAAPPTATASAAPPTATASAAPQWRRVSDSTDVWYQSCSEWETVAWTLPEGAMLVEACAVCLDDHPTGAFLLLACGCRVCVDALEGAVSTSVARHRAEARCPMCRARLRWRDAARTASGAQLKRLRVLAADPLARACPRAGCVGVARGSEPTALRCGACGAGCCSNHGDAHEPGAAPCAVFEAARAPDAATVKLLACTSKRCPGCATNTTRVSGCDHMTCSRCGEHWCWGCGFTRAACACVFRRQFRRWNVMDRFFLGVRIVWQRLRRLLARRSEPAVYRRYYSESGYREYRNRQYLDGDCGDHVARYLDHVAPSQLLITNPLAGQVRARRQQGAEPPLLVDLLLRLESAELEKERASRQGGAETEADLAWEEKERAQAEWALALRVGACHTPRVAAAAAAAAPTHEIPFELIPLPDGWKLCKGKDENGAEEEWFEGLDGIGLWERPTLPFGWTEHAGFSPDNEPEM